MEDANDKKDIKYWTNELELAKKRLRDWHTNGNEIVDRYLAEDKGRKDDGTGKLFLLNLFSSNINTLQAMLYSHLPQIDVSRKYQDANDDLARVAADILERVLNQDMQEHGEEIDAVLKGCLQDRLIPGLGCARVRYEVETETETIGEITADDGTVLVEETTIERVVYEGAPTDYFHWQDVLWGWTRNWASMPWLAYRNYLTREEADERFPDHAQYLTYEVQTPEASEDANSDDKGTVKKAQIWEIWCKDTGTIYFVQCGYDKILDTQPDPLGLKGFYPSPPFLLANPTTRLLHPLPDFILAEDLYNEVDILQSRISIITEAVKVVGLYPANAGDIQRMMKEGFENELIPVDDWAMHAEKGGLRGQIDWFPIQEVVAALNQLIAVRDQTIGLLQQINGMSDVMRGQLENQYEGVGQTQIKAQAGSARVQNLQDQFARFTTDLMQLKAEVICKHFEPESILEQSNAKQSMNANIAPAAVQLLKQPDMAYMRVEIRSETMAQIDYAKLKQDRTEWLNAFSTFLQSSAPLLAEHPDAMPFLMRMLQWTMAGFKGSNEIEGVMDDMIAAANAKAQQPEQPEPSPEQQRAQGEMMKIQAKAQADMQLRQQDMQADIQTAAAQSQAKQQEIAAKFQADSQLELIKGRIAAATQAQEAQGNIAQAEAGANAELLKYGAESMIEIEKEAAKAHIELEKDAESSVREIQQLASEKLIETEANYAVRQTGQQETEPD